MNHTADSLPVASHELLSHHPLRVTMFSKEKVGDGFHGVHNLSCDLPLGREREPQTLSGKGETDQKILVSQTTEEESK